MVQSLWLAISHDPECGFHVTLKRHPPHVNYRDSNPPTETTGSHAHCHALIRAYITLLLVEKVQALIFMRMAGKLLPRELLLHDFGVPSQQRSPDRVWVWLIVSGQGLN